MQVLHILQSTASFAFKIEVPVMVMKDSSHFVDEQEDTAVK